MAASSVVRGIARLAPAKVCPPVVDGRVKARRRIDAMLSGGRRITIVVGPAGYGKTVAVAQWAERAGLPVAWLTLDAHDGPPERFWRYVAAALGHAVPGLGDETISSLDEWGPRGFDIPTTLLAELGERPPLALVLDDLHVVGDAATLEQLAYFLDRSPTWLRTILVSRGEPSLPVARWRAGRLVTEIRQPALALTAAEARDLLSGLDGLHLSEADADLLVARTEGWVAALQLAGLSLEDRSDTTTFLHEALGADRMLVDYVVAEVLDRLPSDERDAVLALSLLDDIDPARCSAMTGVADGAALLRRLRRRGLPLTALGPRQQSVRFHRLFRELVMDELRLRRPGDLVALERRAADAERAAGDVPAAVRHHLAAGDVDAAFDLVVSPVWELYRAGRTREAAVWLRQFSDDFLLEDPARMLSYAAALALLGQLQDAARWHARLAPLVDGDADLSVELWIGRMVRNVNAGDLAAVRADHERLVRIRPQPLADWDPNNRVASAMAIAALADEDLAEAAAWVATIETSRLRPGRGGFGGGSGRRAWLALQQGSLEEADQLAEECLWYADRQRSGGAHVVVEALAVKARVAAERLELDAADRWAEQAADLAAELAAPLHHAIAREAVVGALEARSGAPEALRRLEQMVPSALLTPTLHGRHLLLLAELEARCGRGEEALDRIASLPPGPRRTLVECRVDVLRGQPAGDGLGASASWPRARQIEAELLLHRAQPGELVHLHRALELGVASGFVTTYLREEQIVVALGGAVGAERRWRSSRLATALRDLARARPVLDRPPVQPLSEPLTDRECQILQLLPTHLSAVEIAAQAFVSVNTVRTHIKGIYRKLGVGSRSSAVRRAEALGLIEAALRGP